MITSKQHPLVKTARALRQRNARERHGLILAEGVRLAEAAVEATVGGSGEGPAAGGKIEACLFTSEAAEKGRVREILRRLQDQADCRLLEVDASVFSHAAATEHPQGVLLLIKRRPVELADLATLDPAPRRFVVLDRLQDPGNVGTIVRTSEAAGCDAILTTSGTADIGAPKTLRATMGSAFHLPLVEGLAPGDAVDFLRSWEIPIIATDGNAVTTHYDVDLSGAFAIILGNEGAGLDAAWMEAATTTARIPIDGRAESLNVSAAAAAVLFEAARQRRRG